MNQFERPTDEQMPQATDTWREDAKQAAQEVIAKLDLRENDDDLEDSSFMKAQRDIGDAIYEVVECDGMQIDRLAEGQEAADGATIFETKDGSRITVRLQPKGGFSNDYL